MSDLPKFPMLDTGEVQPDTSGLSPEFIRSRSTWRRPGDPTKINVRGAGAKLETLGFDPIETMVRKYDEIQCLIDNILISRKPSMIAVTQLLGHQQRISEKLMEYGYAKVPTNLPAESDTGEEGFLTIVYADDEGTEASDRTNSQTAPVVGDSQGGQGV
jgi:hypothetical protein